MTDFVVRKQVVDFQVKNFEYAQTSCSAILELKSNVCGFWMQPTKPP
jgi:hypothetical protein